MLKCQDCGNTERFDVGAIEYHRYQVDGTGLFISDLDCGDISQCNDYKCMKCDSWNVQEES